MQVKKFEARTMKEALEMVKTQLGPEAIILSARDNQKSFGLVGQGSVEITAAISEENLLKRKYAEAKMTEQKKAQYSQSSAKIQKDFIQKAVKPKPTVSEPVTYRPMTTRRYIDIADTTEQAQSEDVFNPSVAGERIKEDAQKAWSMMNDRALPATQAVQATSENLATMESYQIAALKSEIETLKTLLGQFKNVPQNMVSTHPGAHMGIPYEFSFLYEKLKSEGVEDREIFELLDFSKQVIPAHKHKNKALLEGLVAKKMLEQTLISDQQQSQEKFHFFFGPSGAGKTSALVKIASQKVVAENKKVALLTTDIFKVGAADQLRIFAQILNVPFAVVRNPQSWIQLQPHFEGVDYVFVDFPGFSLKKLEEVKSLESLIPKNVKSRINHLVLSSVGKFEDLHDIIQRYKTVKIDDLIMSGIDECVQHGNIYSLMRRNQIPLYGFGIGSRLPEDFEYASKERLLDLIFKITSNDKNQGFKNENIDPNN